MMIMIPRNEVTMNRIYSEELFNSHSNDNWEQEDNSFNDNLFSAKLIYCN